MAKITFLDKLLFTKHLSVIVKSGITVSEALAILSDQSKSSKLKKVTESVLKDIENGKTLAKALSAYPKVFNSFYVSLIKIGETSGTLDQSLAYLADQLAKEHSFRQKVKGALLYPAIVLIAAVAVGAGVSYFVLPKLIDLFQGVSITLPPTTQALLFFAEFMKLYGLYVFALLAGFAFLFNFLIKIPAVSTVWYKFVFMVPFFGENVRNYELVFFCRSLGIMLKSGIPITEALEINRDASSNPIFKKYSLQLLDGLKNGKSLSKELSEAKYPNIPIIASRMIAVGEKTGKLDESLMYLGDFFEAEVDNSSKNIAATIEPIMLLVIGLVVAFIALAVISPIYELTGSIKR